MLGPGSLDSALQRDRQSPALLGATALQKCVEPDRPSPHGGPLRSMQDV